MHSYASAAGTVGTAFGEAAEAFIASERMLAQAFSGTVEVMLGKFGPSFEAGGA